MDYIVYAHVEDGVLINKSVVEKGSDYDTTGLISLEGVDPEPDIYWRYEDGKWIPDAPEDNRPQTITVHPDAVQEVLDMPLETTDDLKNALIKALGLLKPAN